MSDRSADRALNREVWTVVNADFTDERALQAWDSTEITWGLFSVPERDLQVLGQLEGARVVELGCGTAYFSAWLARAGARVVGVDLTHAQLNTAVRCQRHHQLRFPVVEADGEAVPLRSGVFELVVSEYGASVWCDPELWVAEAARLLRPGGRLVFLTNSVLATLCVPEDEGYAAESLQRPQRGLGRVQWPGGGVEHHPAHGDWISVLRSHGFVVEALHEVYAPHDAASPDYYEIATAEWARQWPAEDLWVARLGTG